MKEEDPVEQLVRLVGPRPRPPAEVVGRVKAAVHDAWRARVRHRARRRASVWALAVAAGVTLAITSLSRREASTPVGVVEAAASSSHRAGDQVWTRVDVVTPAGARLAVRLDGGHSVRLDEGTVLRFHSASRLSLAQGGVYVDTETGGRGIEVATPLGVARDVGTRFEVRLDHGGLRIRVREGMVAFDGKEEVRSGEELSVHRAGVKRGRVGPDSPTWHWTTRIAPPFALEGKSLRAFLEWVTREQGWGLRFAQASLADSSTRTVLHGSIEGLTPHEALPAVLATSGLKHRVVDGELRVGREVP